MEALNQMGIEQTSIFNKMTKMDSFQIGSVDIISNINKIKLKFCKLINFDNIYYKFVGWLKCCSYYIRFIDNCAKKFEIGIFNL